MKKKKIKPSKNQIPEAGKPSILDPLGMYTGTANDPKDLHPVQDADDL